MIPRSILPVVALLLSSAGWARAMPLAAADANPVPQPLSCTSVYCNKICCSGTQICTDWTNSKCDPDNDLSLTTRIILNSIITQDPATPTASYSFSRTTVIQTGLFTSTISNPSASGSSSPSTTSGTNNSTTTSGTDNSSTPSGTNNSSTTSASSGGLSTGAIIGIVVGVVAVTAIIAGLIVFCMKHRAKQQRLQAMTTPPPPPQPAPAGPPPPPMLQYGSSPPPQGQYFQELPAQERPVQVGQGPAGAGHVYSEMPGDARR